MFGSYTNKLAILGVCAIVYWIICWLLLVSKNERIPGWISTLATAVGVLLGFLTAIPSAIFSIPLYLNYSQVYDKISREEYHRGLNESVSESSQQLKQSYDKGYKAASEHYEKIISHRMEKVNRMYVNYISLYLKCQSNPGLSEMMKDIPEPEGLEAYLKYHKPDQK